MRSSNELTRTQRAAVGLHVALLWEQDCCPAKETTTVPFFVLFDIFILFLQTPNVYLIPTHLLRFELD